jgi:2-polyprenyl-3-methyl-5-hydroxy-6-metoxy-1,4-benzoquinol methylase
MTDSAYQTCPYCDSSLILDGDHCSDNSEILVGSCPTCGLTQLATVDHISVDHYKADDHFPSDLEAWRQREQQWNRKRVQKLLEYIPDICSKRVLDFGCGSGGFLYQARDRIDNLIGFDLSSRICAVHRTEGFECYYKLEDIPKDIDVIVLFHVLEHISVPWDFLSFLNAQFRSCKYFVIEVPNNDEALLSIFASDSYRASHYSAEHLYYFTPATLRNVVVRAGLMPIIETQLQRYTLGNTFGWLRHNVGGRQNVWTCFNDEQLNNQYERVLVEQGAADSIFFVCEVAS